MAPETTIVREVDEGASFVGRWRELAAASGNLFVTPDWYFSWLVVYGDRFEPRLVLCHEGAELVGVLPLVVERRWPGALRFAGDAAADRIAPIAAGGDATVQSALLETALRLAPAIFVLRHLEQSASPPTLGLRAYRIVGRPASLPSARIADGWDAYLARRSRNFRADLKRKERSLRAEGEVAFRQTTDVDELPDDLDVFFRLHDDRWQGRGGSTSSTDRIRLFLGELSRRCLEHGWLRLWQLSAGGIPAAAFLGWSLGPTYSYYLAGFDSRLGRHSPGTVLLAHTIQDAIADGCERYDLLLGDERYKERFADEVELVDSLVLARRYSVPFLLARAEAAGRTTLRRLPENPRAILQQAAARAGTRLPLTRSR